VPACWGVEAVGFLTYFLSFHHHLIRHSTLNTQRIDWDGGVIDINWYNSFIKISYIFVIVSFLVRFQWSPKDSLETDETRRDETRRDETPTLTNWHFVNLTPADISSSSPLLGQTSALYIATICTMGAKFSYSSLRVEDQAQVPYFEAVGKRIKKYRLSCQYIILCLILIWYEWLDYYRAEGVRSWTNLCCLLSMDKQ
jgi:hypothetical protein